MHIINKMDKNNLLEHFIVFCKENFGSENKIKYEEWLNIYANAFVNDLLICKDVICNILKIRSDNINETARNNDIEMIYYNYNKLPTNAIIHNKSKIMQSKNKTWFINTSNFLTLLLLYRNKENKKIVLYMVKLNELTIKFFKKYGDCHLAKYEDSQLKILELDDKQKIILVQYNKVIEERNEATDKYKYMKKVAKYYGYDEDEDYYSFSDSHEYSDEEKCDVQYMKNYEP